MSEEALNSMDLGRPSFAQAHRIVVSFFRGHGAREKHEELYTLEALAVRIRSVSAAKKAELPWLKLARFGDIRTDKDSLRHDANVLVISGVEADYDGGEMAFEEAVEIATKAGLSCIVYTSPSHSEDAPHWRVLCPTSQELPPDRRQKLLGRLNGLYRGIFSGESWALSQSFYFGSVQHNPSHQVEVIEGAAIDLLDELDEIWTGKPQTKATGAAPQTSGPVDEPALLQQIISGESFHAACVRLLGKWARNGVAYMDARQRLEDAFNQVFPPDRDQRWQVRRNDLDRCLEDIYGKEARAKDAGERPSPSRGGKDEGPAPERRWSEPADFLTDDTSVAPVLQEQHIPVAIWGFANDTAKRMGVDPTSVALSALVSCASVISDEWSVQPKRHDFTWTENARLWGAIVGNPSILKTPVIAACTRPIDKLEAEARSRHAEAMRTYKLALSAARADKSGATPEPAYPKLDRYMVEGATVEAISEVLRDDEEAKQRAPQGKVLSRHDEMSEFFGGLDRYKTGGKGGSDRGAYLRLYNGGRYTIDRIGRGAFAVPNWSACYLGGIQPGPIQRIAKDAADDGLLQRFLYCVPDRQLAGVDVPPDAVAVQRYADLFPALVAMTPPAAPGGGASRPVVLAEGSHAHRERVDALARAMANMPDTSPRLRAAYGKWPGIFARLCLTFHLIGIADARARGIQPAPVQVIPERIAERVADFMLDIVLPHLRRADALMFSTDQTGHAAWIAGHILAHELERIITRDITRAYGALRPPEMKRELANVMDSLVSVGWLDPEDPGNAIKSVSTWQVNPSVHTAFAQRSERERARRQEAREQTKVAVEIIRQQRKRREAAA